MGFETQEVEKRQQSSPLPSSTSERYQWHKAKCTSRRGEYRLKTSYILVHVAMTWDGLLAKNKELDEEEHLKQN